MSVRARLEASAKAKKSLKKHPTTQTPQNKEGREKSEWSAHTLV
jgi:hypothetical protein